MITRSKTKRSNHRREFLKPSTRGLLETIQSFAKTTYFIRFVSNTWGRSHVHLFLKITVQEGILYVHLTNFPLTNGGNSNECSNSRHFCNRCKGLLIIHAILLRVSFRDKSGLVSFNRPIRLCFNLVYPSTTNCTLSRWKRNKIPSMGLIKSCQFLSHSILPKRIRDSLSIGFRFRQMM